MNDEAISFTTLRRFEAELAIKDRQIDFLVETLQQVMAQMQAAVDAIQELNGLKEPK